MPGNDDKGGLFPYSSSAPILTWADSFLLRSFGATEDEQSVDFCGPIAQSVEQLAFNQWVAGSIPARLSFFPTQTWLRQDLRDGLGLPP